LWHVDDSTGAEPVRGATLVFEGDSIRHYRPQRLARCRVMLGGRAAT
jgi:hypothetical protein